MDTFSTICTILFFLLLFGILLWAVKDNNHTIVALAITLIIVAIVSLSQVISYEIRDNYFVIQRPIRSIVIPFSEIIRIEKLNENEFKPRKTFGNGGVLGYWGSFTSTSLDEFDFYAKNKKNPILVVVKKEGNIVVSPDDVIMFEELEKNIRK